MGLFKPTAPSKKSRFLKGIGFSWDGVNTTSFPIRHAHLVVETDGRKEMSKEHGQEVSESSRRRTPKDSYSFLPNNVLICDSHSNDIRWQPGERLDHLWEERCDSLPEGHLAVSTKDQDTTYKEMDHQANQLARYLLDKGVQSGDRVGVLFNKSIHAYVALLAIQKVNAAYVPLDAAFPRERVAYICKDAEVSTIVSLSRYEELLEGQADTVIFLDKAQEAIQEKDAKRLTDDEKGAPTDDLSYIIYTSGSTGNPKGVAIDHPSICNFVRVAAEVYGILDSDRMYQGLTLAFDFSVEEIWVPLMAGATLVPNEADGNLVGQDLADFIKERNITAMCCVPTLLATIDEDLPMLRFLLVSGEACPQEIVNRWSDPSRVLLNAYGPTEATVTCTIRELAPGQAVTIGGPLPTYYSMILPEDKNEALPRGETGELCVAGIGLARGYVNRQDLTDRAFIPDFLNIEGNTSKRIYRTGDLARINDNNEIEYLGRIDTQVKIRGYRIELTEIESVIMQVPEVAQAVVTKYSPEEGVVELAAFYTVKDGVEGFSSEALFETLREQLPGYMVPAYLDELDEIPLLPSQKADRKKLPKPSAQRFATTTEYVAPGNETETVLADTLAEVMKIPKVSVEDDFFKSLGAHSLIMARFASAMRKKRPDLEVSMREIYQHPTIRGLATQLESESKAPVVKVERDPFHQATRGEYLLCGALQFTYYIAFYVPLLILAIVVFNWILASKGIVELLAKSVGVSGLFFVILTALPIIAKLVLVGEWKPQRIEIWSLDYFRFWVVRSLQRSSPLLLFSGTPIYNVYLRLLGADIGRNVVNFSRFMPVCTDLITIGDNTVFQKESMFLGYKAENGYIYIGPVTVGRNCYIGEAAVLDINTEMEDNTQLGHASSLQSGQTIPEGKTFHGSPGREATSNYKRVAPVKCTYLRKFLFCMYQVLISVSLLPLGFLAAYYFLPTYFGGGDDLLSLSAQLASINAWYILYLLPGSIFLFIVAVFVGLLYVIFFPRLLFLFLKPDREYPLFGFHYVMYRWVQGITNNQFYKILLGDSSFKPYYYRWLGWGLGDFKQSGSNFGLQERHDIPYLCTIGYGTMVSDGLSLINGDFSSCSFKISPASVGENCFIGNDIHFPPNARVGDNCLFASKVMLPVDGPIRENVGLLGSPPFEIPRETYNDEDMTPEELEAQRLAQLPGKDKSNIWTLGTYLFVRWFIGFQALLVTYVVFVGYASFGISSFIVGTVFSFFYGIGFLILIERMTLRFKKLEPKNCTIYDPYFWQVEHFWKHCENGLISLFKGTPFKPMIARMLGMKVGKQVFDDGLQASERSLVEIGDHAILNEGIFLQSHSLEDGYFKSDRIIIGNECTVSVRGYVHYGTEMKDGSILDPDSFLMKGEVVEQNTIWQGNPAQVIF